MTAFIIILSFVIFFCAFVLFLAQEYLFCFLTFLSLLFTLLFFDYGFISKGTAYAVLIFLNVFLVAIIQLLEVHYKRTQKKWDKEKKEDMKKGIIEKRF